MYHEVLLYEHALIYNGKECGVFFDDANPKYLKSDYRQAGDGFIYHYVECYCDEDKKGKLCEKLISRECGASEPKFLNIDEGNILVTLYGNSEVVQTASNLQQNQINKLIIWTTV